ncbi:MAG TPA: PP0621 family protein [Candidatus Binatia bacterium]
MLLRVIIFIIVGYIVVSAIKAHFAARRGGLRRDAADGDGEEMVLDPQCQSYLPKREAIYQEGKYFCSRECANLFLSH